MKNRRKLSWLIAALLISVGAFGAELAPPGMARIPNGVFHPFYTAANEPKQIHVKAFCLDIAPVSNRGFLDFIRANPRWQRSHVKRIFAD